MRQRSEQNRTSSHTRSHFLRQENGRPQAAQVFTGRSRLATALPEPALRGMRQVEAELGGGCGFALAPAGARAAALAGGGEAGAAAAMPGLDIVGRIGVAGRAAHGSDTGAGLVGSGHVIHHAHGIGLAQYDASG